MCIRDRHLPVKRVKATQQSATVGILGPDVPNEDNPPKILLGHSRAVEADQIDYSDCGR